VSARKVYAAITFVAAELSKTGIQKLQTNADDQYQFRGIDDVLKRLSPALALAKLCILPRVLERSVVDRVGTNGGLLISVSLKVAFDLVSAEDGSSHTIEAYGEALDAADKATAKAMTAAYKYAVLQTFCVPVSGTEDADANTHRLRASEHVPEPVQGWEQWLVDIADVVRVCETGEALDRLQNMNRSLLKSISRERPDLYSRIGEIIRDRRKAITEPDPVPNTRAKPATAPSARAAPEASKSRKKRSARGPALGPKAKSEANGSDVNA
jgi:hypothetical protein